MKVGFAFGEHIKTEKIGRRKKHFEGNFKLQSRNYIFPLIIALAGVILISKMFSLQIVNGAKYKALSDSNRIRTEIIRAPRGVIYDQSGIPLVQNEPGFRRIFNCDKHEKKTQETYDGKCVEVIDRSRALELIANGEEIEVASQRTYLLKDSMSHVLGYIGQISKEEIDSNEYKNYNGLDWVGKTGIEREYEDILKGIDGAKLKEVDAMGGAIRELGTTDPIPGKDIILTIDAHMQEVSFRASEEMKRGVVIVSTPDGQILSMVSRPSFDPNLFTRDETYKVASESAYKNASDVLTDTVREPLLNRAIGGVYPPGSTFKIVTAVAGLAEKIIDEDYNVKDTGILKVGEFSYANWYYTNYGRTDGEVNVVRGLSRSNDIFFYKLAEKVGVGKISETAKKMGLGKRTGVDLPGEVNGLVPNPDWKLSQIGETWYLGDTFHYGIGQGYLLATPIQVNLFTQVIANGGDLYIPHLLKVKNQKPKTTNLLSEKTLNLIRQGMIDSCKPKIGVAWPLFEFKVENPKLKIDGLNILEAKIASGSAKKENLREIVIACKTGTAQFGGEETLPHAWITLFAPAYDPEIVITVLNEESGEGSNEAAPIAKKILEAWFSNVKH